ncbi:MAG: restriction endonuclease subunit S [Anaerovibrio sp.]
MGLTKYRLGDLLEQCDARNADTQYSLDDVRGISIQKVFIETKADMTDVSLAPYKLVKSGDFAYVTVTSRNGGKITLAHNITSKTYIVSSSYIVFKVKKAELLLPDYLFMYFNRPEFDRYARFNSWGSARETFDWEDFCDIEIELPDIATQQKYVDIYNAMLANQQSYERGLDDLKIAFEGYIDNLRKEIPLQRIGSYIEISGNVNSDEEYGLDAVRGVSNDKQFITTKANMKDVDLKPYLLVKPQEFAYVTVTSRNGNKISIAYNSSDDTYICSSSYVVFLSKDLNTLLPQYLHIYFSRSEFDRYARFNSWGSARETFDFNDMKDVKIPIPDIEIQKSIANLYEVYIERRQINEKLKAQIKNICPILIKGSIEDGLKGEA